MSRYIDTHRGRFGVEPVCRVLDVSASAYYQRATGQRSERVIEDERLLDLIKATHAANYFAYGYRKMCKGAQASHRNLATPTPASGKINQTQQPDTRWGAAFKPSRRGQRKPSFSHDPYGGARR